MLTCRVRQIRLIAAGMRGANESLLDPTDYDGSGPLRFSCGGVRPRGPTMAYTVSHSCGAKWVLVRVGHSRHSKRPSNLLNLRVTRMFADQQREGGVDG